MTVDIGELVHRVIALEQAVSTFDDRLTVMESWLDRVSAALEELTAWQWTTLERLQELTDHVRGPGVERPPRKRTH